MRQFLFGILVITCCNTSSAAELMLDPNVPLQALGLSELTPLPAIGLEIPLPEGVDSALPTIVGRPDGRIEFEPGRSRAFPDLPGLGALSLLEMEIELPGMDGLPMQIVNRTASDAPQIPGFDGLPLGFGRQ